MPHHIISPTPSQQGLGITYSTLSPSPAPSQSSTPPRFTGLGAGARSSPTRPSFIRGTQQLFQPTFSLRATHTSNTSVKGFTTFSAIPPSPMGPRSPARLPLPLSSTVTSESEHIPEFLEHREDRRLPSRRGSVASNATSTSRTPKKSKSSELLGRFSKNDTVSGGRYIPLSGEEDPNPETAEASSSSSPRQVQSRSRSTTISTSAATPSQSQAASLGPSPSSDSHAFAPGSFPMPPTHPPMNTRTQSDPAGEQSHHYQAAPQPRGMSRSFSQPLNLQPLPEADDESSRYARRSQHSAPNRISDPATGIHSRNAVLLSAEAGGMMLAFSPSGDGVWREGEMIVGGGTGLIPTPATHQAEQMSRKGYSQEDLGARLWSESTMSPPQRPGALGHRGRSLSDGVMLVRQGTLFHPASSSQRASAELGVMLGGQRWMRSAPSKLLPPPDLEGWQVAGGLETEKVRLEASKKRRARVEVGVVLERECVVEGGEIRGRMEVRVTGGKRGEGLRVGGGKVRVVGFEELSPTARHIFYHHPHPLPLFTNQPHLSGLRSSLFASDPDSEGYRLATEGVHNIPFRVRLPLRGGAKGSYTSSGGKGPSVRYVVVGSIKIHVPGTGKRSIAHFYRSIVVLPYLNPEVVLAPGRETVEGYVEKGWSWSLGGEKGKVQLRIALGRRMWVSGQRMWCEVGIWNDSSRKIKTLNLALLQTVQTFNPQPLLDTTDFRTHLVRNRTSMKSLNAPEPATPDADACQTNTQRRKVSEEVLEADFTEHGVGRVTGKGWWTGVEAGERGQWDLSLQIPSGMISIRRTRLIEVLYTLRVTVNSSIYVDVPVDLINFLSIDPPPMPGFGMRMSYPPMQQNITNPGVYERPQANRMPSDESLTSSGNPAKASSTTLHLDALLQAGRARAEADGQGEAAQAHARPLSMGSQYTMERINRSSEAIAVQPGADDQMKPPVRPKGARMMSYLSTKSQSDASSFEGDEQDKTLLAISRAQGRQKSLAAINRAMDRAAAAEVEEIDLLSPNRESVHGDYFPAQTPVEESYKIMGDNPTFAAEAEHQTPMPVLRAEIMPDQEALDDGVRAHEVIVEVPGEEEEEEEEEEQRPVDQETKADQGSFSEEDDGLGNETILEDLVGQHGTDGSPGDSDVLTGEFGGYDYADEVEYGDETGSIKPKRVSLPIHLPSLDIDPRLSFSTLDLDRQQHIAQTGSISGSFATDYESEEGKVYEATKRNVSVRLPPLILPFDAVKLAPGSLAVPQGGPRRSCHTPIPTRETGSISSRGDGVRRGSAPIIHPLRQGMRRESTNPPVPSPLRPVEEALQARVIPKKSSFSFATPGSPLRVREASESPSKASSKAPLATSEGISPRSAISVTLLNPPSPAGEKMVRQPSGNSQLRNQVSVRAPSNGGSDGEGGPPGLAASVASDSASSDGQDLESPPVVQLPPNRSSPKRALPKAPDLSGFTLTSGHYDKWQPPEHLLDTSVNLVHTHLEPVSPPESPGSSTHSILPSVRSKIAQLESRDEALRKFSVSAAVSQPPTPERAAATKRRSYTAALAPRPVRSANDDLDERSQLGETTYVGRKPYADHWRMHSPRDDEFGGRSSVLRRHLSAASTSTSATAIEEALLGWDGPESTRSREYDPLGSTRSREYVDPLRSSKSRGYVEIPRSREYGENGMGGVMGGWEREVLRPANGVTVETEDSEGLL